MTNALVSATQAHATALPSMWAVIPFAGLLLSIGIVSFVCANFPHSILARLWERNRNKLVVALLWSVPVLILLAVSGAWDPFLTAMEDYFSFISLLFALFVISGGIYLEGDLVATPRVNTAFLALGALLANLIGTTGASLLLIRPVLKTNSERKHTAHIPVFFIFVVSNIGGALLPIGDPPLFLGYLKGVPFFWTLSLVMPWLTAVALVLLVFFIWDARCYGRETDYSRRKDRKSYAPLRVRGGINFLWLLGVLVAIVVLTPAALTSMGISTGPLKFLREYVMLVMAGASLLTAPLTSTSRRENNFTFGPIQEVMFLFIGIFITMIPALEILRMRGIEFGIARPWQFFWASGMLSGALDNAPTYLTFLSLAQGLSAANPALYPVPATLAGVAAPANLVAAISLGSVFMGANTYIGNGPNFMVKAIADEWGCKTPDFFSYILKYSLPVLIPVFIVITVIFLRG